jgi:mevalonate kinase
MGSIQNSGNQRDQTNNSTLQQDEFFGWSKSKRTPQLIEIKEVEIVGDCEYESSKREWTMNWPKEEISVDKQDLEENSRKIEPNLLTECERLLEEAYFQFQLELKKSKLDEIMASHDEQLRKLRLKTQKLVEISQLFKSKRNNKTPRWPKS